MSDKEFSGRISIRIPKSLHKELSITAKQEAVTLNQYIVYLLSMNNELVKAKSSDCFYPVAA